MKFGGGDWPTFWAGSVLGTASTANVLMGFNSVTVLLFLEANLDSGMQKGHDGSNKKSVCYCSPMAHYWPQVGLRIRANSGRKLGRKKKVKKYWY